MKQPMMMMVLAAVVLAGQQSGLASDVQATAAQPKAEATPGVLTAKQIDALVTKKPDAEGNVIRFTANVEQVKRLTADQTKKYTQSGTIPCRITADAYLFTKDGKRIGRVDGDIQFYVLDVDGNVVVTGKRSTKQMCPT